MRIINPKYRIEAYYFLISILYFVVIQNMWVFRKVNVVADISFKFFLVKYSLVSVFVIYTIKIFKKKEMSFFSRNSIVVFLFLDFIPSSLLFSSVTDNNNGLLIYISHVILFYSLIFISTRSFKINFPVLNKKQSLFLLIIVLVIGTSPYLRYLRYLDFKNLLLQDVYVTRLKFRGLFDSYSGYTHSWFTRVIIPIVFVYALKFKIKIIAILNFILLLFLYLMGAVKSVLLGSILVIVFYFIKKDKYVNVLSKSLIFLTIVGIIMSFFVIDDLNKIPVLLHRRLMFVPSLLDFCYFEFYDNNYLYWSNSFLKGILEYNYSETPSRIIALNYFEKPLMAANNGLVSDGFYNAGFFGIIINIFLVNLYLIIINSCRVDTKFFGVYFFMILGFLSSSLSTVLITHGGLLLILLTLFLLRNKQNSCI